MKKALCTWALCALPLMATADTIHVEHVMQAGPIRMYRPFATDSVNQKGDKFDVNSYLSSNTSWAQQHGTTVLKDGQALLSADYQTDAPALTSLYFTLETRRFVKARLDIRRLKDYKVFVDEKELTGKELRLTPGRTEVTLLALTDTAKHDTLDIRLTGDGVSHISVNPTDKRPYTMGEMMWGDHPYYVRISPTGKFYVTCYYDMKRDGNSVYRTIVSETATGRTIQRRDGYVNYLWMPRRDVLYYTRNGVHGDELVSFDPATNEEKVLADRLPSTSFTLSPDENYLIYSKNEGGKTENNGLRRLFDPDDRMPGWRTRSTLWQYDLKSGVNRQLTYGSESTWLSDISDDGRYLLIGCNRMRPNRHPFQSTTFVRMDMTTTKVDTLIADTTFLVGAVFSPDAKSLLVKATPAAFDGIGSEVREGQTPQGFDYRLYLYNIAERTVTPLLCDFEPSVDRTEWSRADGMIYFHATAGTDAALFRLNPTTREVVRFRLPVSYVSGYSIAMMQKKPTAIFFGQTGERARDMYQCSLSSTTPKSKHVGEVDFDRMYKDVAIGSCHDWKFRSTRGDSIDGFYFLPPDFDATKKYPLIVYYYGGCTPTSKTLEFHYPLQVLAGQGYVVYALNPSGAIGYGQEFAARHVNTWGNESGDDIIEGTKRFVRDHNFIDGSKVGCMGASYGGFMTQYLQTRTDIFAAAVSHAGISNIASYWGGGYWGYTYGEVAQYGSYPWNKPDLYVKQSPLFNADKIHTPLLLLHGTVDTNVPTNESQQLFTALRILGRPVSYIQVEGQNHVITDYHKRLVWQNAIFAWFAHWLKDQPEWWKELYPDDDFGIGEEAK